MPRLAGPQPRHAPHEAPWGSRSARGACTRRPAPGAPRSRRSKPSAASSESATAEGGRPLPEHDGHAVIQTRPSPKLDSVGASNRRNARRSKSSRLALAGADATGRRHPRKEGLLMFDFIQTILLVGWRHRAAGAGSSGSSSRWAPGSSAEGESGLVIKRFGRPLPPGRLVALARRGRLPGADAAAGLALRPVALAVQGRARAARRGAARGDRPRRRQGRRGDARRAHARRARWTCDNFQDAEAFLAERRRAGRQSASSPRATTASTRRCSTWSRRPTRAKHGIDPAQLRGVPACPPDRVGIVTVLDGRPIPAGDLAGPVVERPRQLPERRRRSSTRAAAAACRRRCCCRARGTSTRGSSRWSWCR